MSYVAFVIEYVGGPPCWIAEARGQNAFDVTFQIAKAQTFQCLEDAKHEILRLGLPGIWAPKPRRGLDRV